MGGHSYVCDECGGPRSRHAIALCRRCFEDKKHQRQCSTLVLDGWMTRQEIIEAMEKLVFTAARNWRRTLVVDRNVRDVIIGSLRIDRKEKTMTAQVENTDATLS